MVGLLVGELERGCGWSVIGVWMDLGGCVRSDLGGYVVNISGGWEGVGRMSVGVGKGMR